jgi:hypothetical protein
MDSWKNEKLYWGIQWKSSDIHIRLKSLHMFLPSIILKLAEKEQHDHAPPDEIVGKYNF